MNLRRIFTDEEKAFIAANYTTHSYPQLDKILGRPPNSVQNYLTRAGLRKGGQSNSHFQPGNKPWNVGIPFRPAIRPAADFKPGHATHNASRNGAVTIRHHSNGSAYKFRRIGPRNWVLSHRWNWQQANGAIPAGCVLRCKDNNTLNDAATNWEPVSRRRNAELSGIWAENRASDMLTPEFLAASLTRGRPELRPLVLATPELLEVQRLKITLNRALKS